MLPSLTPVDVLWPQVDRSVMCDMLKEVVKQCPLYLTWEYSELVWHMGYDAFQELLGSESEETRAFVLRNVVCGGKLLGQPLRVEKGAHLQLWCDAQLFANFVRDATVPATGDATVQPRVGEVSRKDPTPPPMPTPVVDLHWPDLTRDTMFEMLKLLVPFDIVDGMKDIEWWVGPSVLRWARTLGPDEKVDPEFLGSRVIVGTAEICELWYKGELRVRWVKGEKMEPSEVETLYSKRRPALPPMNDVDLCGPQVPASKLRMYSHYLAAEAQLLALQAGDTGVTGLTEYELQDSLAAMWHWLTEAERTELKAAHAARLAVRLKATAAPQSILGTAGVNKL